MADLDLLMRGGAVALALLLILHLIVTRLDVELRLAGGAFLMGVIGYSLISARSEPFDLLPIELLARICAPLFWWFALCLFDERPRHVIVAGLVVAYLANPLLFPDPVSNIIHQVISVSLLGHVIYLALTGLAEDLVQPRRRFRVTIGVILPLTGFVIAYFETFPQPQIEDQLLLLQALAYLVFAIGGTAWMTVLDTDLFPGPRRPGPENPRDQADLEKVSNLMASGVHRTEGLTISNMATQLAIPEHRLRRLINQHMGYRNFSELLNDLRIDDAKSRLADPETGRQQISQIAYAVGFASLAPFNRAFRERTGQSPSDFRRDALDLA